MDGGELLLGLAEVAGQGGGGAAGVGDEQPGAADRAGGVGAVVAAELPGGQGGAEPPADLGQQLRQAGRGERQLATPVRDGKDIDMADLPPCPGTSSVSDGTGISPGSRPGGGRPRWKTAPVWVAVIVLLLVMVILHLTGVVGAGTNG